MPKCQIKWIDQDGKPTPDENEAIGECWIEAYVENCAYAMAGVIQHPRSDNFPICAEHAKQLSKHGMHHWRFAVYEANPEEN
jgi:hypothetical protein